MRPGSKLRICFALGLLTLSLTQDCEILRARGFSIPLDFGPRSVSVLLDRNIVIRHTSIPARDSTEKGWHNLTALQKGSAFCVDAPTLLGDETCDKKNYLILITSSTTSWKLDCPGVAQAPEGTPQCRHYLLYVLYLGLDSGPTSFYWKPNAVATRLKVINLSAEAKFHHETDVWAKDTATWMDVNLGRDPDGGPCRVYSKRLHLSYQCSETFNKSHFLPFLGIDKDHNRRPSYFAFNCSGIPEVVSEDVPHKTELRSPLEIVSHKTEPWFPFAIVAAVVVVVIGVVLVVITAVWVVVKVRKSRSSSQAAIPADDLHDPGRDDREGEHEYWDIDSVVLRAQLEERRATRTRHDGGTTRPENSICRKMLPEDQGKEAEERELTLLIGFFRLLQRFGTLSSK